LSVWESFLKAGELLVRWGRRLNADGLTVGTAGNLSMRWDDLIAVTPSGMPWEDIGPEDCALVRVDGRVLHGVRRPSSELPLHLAVYTRTPAQAIVHTHSPEAVAVSVTGSELPPIHYAIVRLGGRVPVIPYHRYGTAELADAVATGLADRTAVLLQNHGVVTYGMSIAQAYERALLVEWLARVYRLALQMGTPRYLSDDELTAVLRASHRGLGRGD
jgi:L-fuculose-phosphate aldolase